MTKSRYTRTEHFELGQALYAMRNDLLRRSMAYSRAFPRSGNSLKTINKFEKAIKALDEVRCLAEEDLFEDFPNASTEVYYPGAGRIDNDES